METLELSPKEERIIAAATKWLLSTGIESPTKLYPTVICLCDDKETRARALLLSVETLSRLEVGGWTATTILIAGQWREMLKF